MTNQMYVDGFKLMAKHKIRSTCNVMIGFPGEYEEDVFDTIKVNKTIRSIDKELTSCDEFRCALCWNSNAQYFSRARIN